MRGRSRLAFGPLRLLVSAMALYVASHHPVEASESAWQTIAESGEVRVAVIPDRPCYFDRSGVPGGWQGFPVEIAKQIVGDLSNAMHRKLKIVWTPSSWSTVILDVQASKTDLFVGLAMTEQRKDAVDMFGPLWSVPDVIIARKGLKLPSSWGAFDTARMRVAVAMGTTAEQTAQRLLPHARIRGMKNSSDALLDVMSNNSDIVVTTFIAALAALSQNPQLGHLVVPRPISAIPTGGIARADTDNRLRRFLDSWAATNAKTDAQHALILGQLKACGLNTALIPNDVKF